MIGWLVLAVFLLALSGLAFAGSSRTTKRSPRRDDDLDGIDHRARLWTGIF
ncbi:MAG TPA: hypothetical protein VD859_05815 [Nocardioides sp.]|nr:hypothetical protein [Nocardioides sp.]